MNNLIRVIQYPCGCQALAPREVCTVSFESSLPKCEAWKDAARKYPYCLDWYRWTNLHYQRGAFEMRIDGRGKTAAEAELFDLETKS